MNSNIETPYLAISLSLLLATLLSISPLPAFVSDFKPAFLVIFIVFWTVHATHFRLWYSWVIGLLNDVLLASLLGQHALGYILIAFLSSTVKRQFGMLALWQQTGLVAIITFPYTLLMIFINGATDQSINANIYWYSYLATIVFWPIVWTLFKRKARF